MRKLFTLILPIFLVGCATVQTESVLETVQPTPVFAPTPAPPPLVLLPTAPDTALATMPEPVSAPMPAPVTASKPISIKAAVIKKVYAILAEESAKDIPVPDQPAPSVPLRVPKPTAPGPDYRTGAKIQFLGIDLELWLGQNDSWSTIFKMITFMLVTYGGLRGINSLFGKRKRRQNINYA